MRSEDRGVRNSRGWQSDGISSLLSPHSAFCGAIASILCHIYIERLPFRACRACSSRARKPDINHPVTRRGEPKLRVNEGARRVGMPQLDTKTTTPELTEKERKNKVAQHNQLRPLARRADLWEEEEYSSEEYERMMEMYNGTLASIEEGEIVKSRVLEIRDNMVVLDIGFKSEGTVPREEFKEDR